MRRVARAGLLAAVPLVLFAAGAEASGLSVARMGAEHGHPTTANATAVFYNPAGIALARGTHVFLDGSFAWRSVTYEHTTAATDVPEPPGAEEANTGEASLFNFVVSPMIGATTRFGDLALGAGFYTPFGGQSRWDERSEFGNSPFPGPVDGVQRWYAIEGELISSFYTLAVAYDFGALHVGLSGNLIQSRVHTLRARTPAGTNDIMTEGRSLLEVSGLDWSFGAGVVYEVEEDVFWLGASYQSRPGVTGGMRLDGTLENDFPRSQSDDEVDLLTDLPDSIRLGARYRPDEDMELRLFGDYQRWSVLERQCVVNAGADCNVAADGSQTGSDVVLNQPRDWHDTFAVRVGGSYWVDPDVEFLAGLGFSSNAIPDETLEPSLADWHTLSAAVGGRIGLGELVHVAGTYTQLYSLPRDNSGQSELAELLPPSRGPDAGGKYTQLVGVVNVNVELTF